MGVRGKYLSRRRPEKKQVIDESFWIQKDGTWGCKWKVANLHNEMNLWNLCGPEIDKFLKDLFSFLISNPPPSVLSSKTLNK